MGNHLEFTVILRQAVLLVILGREVLKEKNLEERYIGDSGDKMDVWLLALVLFVLMLVFGLSLALLCGKSD